jgi:DNA-binding Xre family transcriptional regulator
VLAVAVTERLRREAKNMNQSELAEATECSLKYVKRMENGEVDFRLNTMVALCEVLELPSPLPQACVRCRKAPPCGPRLGTTQHPDASKHPGVFVYRQLRVKDWRGYRPAANASRSMNRKPGAASTGGVRHDNSKGKIQKKHPKESTRQGLGVHDLQQAGPVGSHPGLGVANESPATARAF